MPSQALLFVDQVDSTRLLATIGDEAMVGVRRRLQQLMTSSVERHDGRVFGDMGDGLAAAFETAQSAAHAALTMQQAADATASGDEPSIEVRVGLHHGDVVPNGDGFIGMSVHVAARLCDAAPAGHIAVSESFALELGEHPDLTITPFERRVMKGIAEPMLVRLLTDPQRERSMPDRGSSAGAWRIQSTPWLETGTASDSIVGRGQELAELHQLDLASEERVHLALVDGEPGIGKTSLLRRFGSECARSGRLCVVGRSDESQPVPYREFIEAFAYVLPQVPDAIVADHVLRHGHLLARLIPGLEHRAGLSPDDGQDEEPERFRLFEAVTDLLRAITRHQPMILIIEDLHWCAEPSLALLQHLTRSLRLPSLLIVASFRPTEQPSNEVLGTFLDRVADDNVRRIRLRPLGPAHVEEMVADLPFADLADQLHAKTGGSPLFLSEMIRSFSEAGQLRTADDGSLLVPDTVQELATGRVDRLGPAHRAVLADAAVLGNTFQLGDVERLAANHIDVLATLEEAAQAGVVLTHPVEDDAFVFGHAVVRDALYERISAPRRRRRHHAVVDAILAADPETVYRRSAEVLRHIDLSGQHRPADLIAQLARSAAEQAATRLDLTEAVRLHAYVVEVLRAQPPTSAAQRVELIEACLRLGAAQTAAGNDQGRATFVDAANQARDIGRWDLFSEAASGYGGQLKENQAIVDVSEPAGLVAEALSHEPEPTSTRARLLTILALWQRQHVPYLERRRLTDESLAIARSLGDKRVLSNVLAENHRALHSPFSTDEALEASIELEQLAAELGDDLVALQAANLRLQAEFELSHWDAAHEQAARLETLASRVGTIEGKRVSLLWQSTVASMQGDAELHHKVVRDLDVLIADFPPSVRSIMLGAAGMTLPWLSGQSAVLFEFAQAFAPPSIKAMFAADSGKPEIAAREVVAAGGPERLLVDQNYLFFQDALGMTRAARTTGDTDLAARLFDVLSPLTGRSARMGLVAFLGSVDHHLGSLAAVLDKPALAIEHYSTALRLHTKMGARPWVALTLAEMAMVERRVGAADAEEHRAQAAAIADELGLGLVTETLESSG